MDIILEALSGHLKDDDWGDTVAEHTRLTEEEWARLSGTLGINSMIEHNLRELAKGLEKLSPAEIAHKGDRAQREQDLTEAVPVIKAALKAAGLRLNADQWKDRDVQTPVTARVSKPKRYWRHEGRPYVEIGIYGVGGAELGLKILAGYEIGACPTLKEATTGGIAHFTILGKKPEVAG